MLKIRLARKGRKNRPFYKIVVTDSRSPRDSSYIEEIGTYDPLIKTNNQKDKITITIERLNYWIACGAQLTETVLKLVSKKTK